jgi:hypothetical protein
LLTGNAAEPKTERGRRSLALDERTVAVLEAHRRRQLEERIALGREGIGARR